MENSKKMKEQDEVGSNSSSTDLLSYLSTTNPHPARRPRTPLMLPVPADLIRPDMIAGEPAFTLHAASSSGQPNKRSSSREKITTKAPFNPPSKQHNFMSAGVDPPSKQQGKTNQGAHKLGDFNAGKFFIQPSSDKPKETAKLREMARADGGGMVQIGTWKGLGINMQKMDQNKISSTHSNGQLVLPNHLAAEVYRYATSQEKEMMATDAGLEVVVLDEDGREYSMLCKTKTYTTSDADEVKCCLVLTGNWAALARAHGGSSVQFIPNAKTTDSSLLVYAFRYKDGRLCLVFFFNKPQCGADDDQ